MLMSFLGSLHQINLKVLEMGPLRFSKDNIYKTFTRPFQVKRSPLIKLKVTFLVR